MSCREHLEMCFSNNFCAGQKMSTYSNVGHAQRITHRLYELYEVIGGQLGLLTWLSTCSWMSFFLGCLLAAGFRLDKLFWWWQLAPDCLFHHSQLYWSCVTHFQVLRQVSGEKWWPRTGHLSLPESWIHEQFLMPVLQIFCGTKNSQKCNPENLSCWRKTLVIPFPWALT